MKDIKRQRDKKQICKFYISGLDEVLVLNFLRENSRTMKSYEAGLSREFAWDVCFISGVLDSRLCAFCACFDHCVDWVAGMKLLGLVTVNSVRDICGEVSYSSHLFGEFSFGVSTYVEMMISWESPIFSWSGNI